MGVRRGSAGEEGVAGRVGRILELEGRGPARHGRVRRDVVAELQVAGAHAGGDRHAGEVGGDVPEVRTEELGVRNLDRRRGSDQHGAVEGARGDRDRRGLADVRDQGVRGGDVDGDHFESLGDRVGRARGRAVGDRGRVLRARAVVERDLGHVVDEVVADQLNLLSDQVVQRVATNRESGTVVVDRVTEHHRRGREALTTRVHDAVVGRGDGEAHESAADSGRNPDGHRRGGALFRKEDADVHTLDDPAQLDRAGEVRERHNVVRRDIREVAAGQRDQIPGLRILRREPLEDRKVHGENRRSTNAARLVPASGIATGEHDERQQQHPQKGNEARGTLDDPGARPKLSHCHV